MLSPASPSVSEAQVDISGAIAEGYGSRKVSTIDNGRTSTKHRNSSDATGMLDLDAQSDVGADGDEAYIANQQAASNRKASNLKGRTVKKGGGFQAMGMLLQHAPLSSADLTVCL